jgi:soluble lytic murein transglycosylase
MSKPPFDTHHPRTPVSHFSFKRFIYGGIALAVVLTLIYSGAVWLLLRPVIYKPIINKYAGYYKFDPLWVMALIRVESRFARTAQSHRGAVGLMQLLPPTARELAGEVGLPDFKDEDLMDPDINLHLGFHYLAKLQRQFPDDEVAVLAAYNAGPRVTQEWRASKPTLDISDIPYPETRRFVRQVQVTYTFLKSLQRWKHLFGID